MAVSPCVEIKEISENVIKWNVWEAKEDHHAQETNDGEIRCLFKELCSFSNIASLISLNHHHRVAWGDYIREVLGKDKSHRTSYITQHTYLSFSFQWEKINLSLPWKPCLFTRQSSGSYFICLKTFQQPSNLHKYIWLNKLRSKMCVLSVLSCPEKSLKLFAFDWTVFCKYRSSLSKSVRELEKRTDVWLSCEHLGSWGSCFLNLQVFLYLQRVELSRPPYGWLDLAFTEVWSLTNAAFTCYQNYRKYEFPNRKLDVNGLSSRIYYWEIRK